jgi:hypothetical protein
MPGKVAMKKPPPPEVPIDHYHLKVSGPSSSCQCSVVGRIGASFGAPEAENRGLARVPWCHRCESSAPPLSAVGVSPPSDPKPTATITRVDTPSMDLI